MTTDISSTTLDRINQQAWATGDALRQYARSASWTDPGEQAAVESVAMECSGTPILDVGVGAGRTIPILTAISSDYIGIDYTPELLDLARGRFPDVDLREMDARNMAHLPSGHFGLVMFSFNGIDAVDYDDRIRILTELRRVTRPGGLILFSTHNRNGPHFGEHPLGERPRWSPNPLRFGWRVLRVMRKMPLWVINYRRNKRLHRDYDGYSIHTAAAHSFGIVIVYTTLTEQRRQLGELGLSVEAVFGSDGTPVVTEGEGQGWFHVIARKTPDGRAVA